MGVGRLCIPAALALALVMPASASAWDGKQRLTEAGPRPFAVAGNEQGRRVVAWADNTGVYLTVAPRGARFGRVHKVAGAPRKSGVQVAVDARGDVAITWAYDTQEVLGDDLYGDYECCHRLMGAILRRDGRLSRPVMLGLKGKENHDALLTGQSNGHIGFAFWSEQVMYARFGTMRGGFGRLVKVAPDAGRPLSVRDGRVVYDSYDVSQSAVETTRGSTRQRVVHDGSVFLLDSDDRGRQTGVWGSFQHLAIGFRTPPAPFTRPSVDRPGSALALDVAGGGSVAVLWQVEDQTAGSENPDVRLFASLRRPDGAALRAPVLVERSGLDLFDAFDVAAAPRGAAAVGAVVSGARGDEARVYLVPRAGKNVRKLVALRALSVGGVRVLRDARGTFVVAATDRGLVARWMR